MPPSSERDTITLVRPSSVTALPVRKPEVPPACDQTQVPQPSCCRAMPSPNSYPGLPTGTVVFIFASWAGGSSRAPSSARQNRPRSAVVETISAAAPTQPRLISVLRNRFPVPVSLV